MRNRFAYDHEGNCTQRYKLDGNNVKFDVTDYGWDYFNRLTSVTERNAENGPATKVVEYTYDYAGRMIRRTVDADGADPTLADTSTYTVYDGVLV